MKNKKTLHLAIALAISSMPLFGVAEAARGSMYGGESVGDDVTIEASANAYPSLVGHAFGIYTNVTNSATVTSAGNRLTITILQVKLVTESVQIRAVILTGRMLLVRLILVTI